MFDNDCVPTVFTLFLCRSPRMFALGPQMPPPKTPNRPAWMCVSAHRVNWFTRPLKTSRHDERMV